MRPVDKEVVTQRAAPDRLSSGSRRAEVVQAAYELFAEFGYRGVSLARVAQRLGLSNAGVLHYFASKEELLTAVLVERDRQTVETAHLAHASDESVHTKLEQWRAVAADNARRAGLTQAFTVLAAESVIDGHPAQPFFRERYAKLRRHLAATIENDPDFELTAGDAHTAAAIVIAVMDGLQVQWLLDPAKVDMEAAFALFERMLEGLGLGYDAAPVAAGDETP